VNLTAALTAWRWPLLPREVYTNDDFLGAIAAQKGGARATLRSYHESRDPAIADVEKLVDDVQSILTELQAEVNVLTGEDLSEARDLCLETIDEALGTLGKGRDKKIFRPLLNPVQGGLPSIVRACQDELNATLGNPKIRAIAGQLGVFNGAIDTIFKTRVNAAAVEQKADADFAIVDRTLSALVNEINLVSVDPVVIFDTAYVGPSSSPFIRNSVGGGLRLTVGSVAAFTLGYAANPNRSTGEPGGSVFFELKVFDLFR
jgi:hypothetical protein